MRAEDLRGVIRELLAEELAKLRAGAGGHGGTEPRPPAREEQVSIRSDAELAAFVERLVALMKDAGARAEIESGRRVFRLAHGASATVPRARAAAPAARFERGLVTEREVQALPAGTAELHAGKRVRLTPLAKDLLRARGIVIRRSDP